MNDTSLAENTMFKQYYDTLRSYITGEYLIKIRLKLDFTF